MGAYRCEYGVVHKVCRCPTPHTIKCDKVEEHSGQEASLPVQPCAKVVFNQLGKREKHEPHRHLYSAPLSNIVSEYQCPGRD